MSELLDPSRAQLRWGVYALLITLAAGNLIGRILAVNSVDLIGLEAYLQREAQESGRGDPNRQLQRPFLSANDRSRWLTIRSLVEYGTYEIDGVLDRQGWDSIDKVRHRNRQGELRFYSSKPPLLPTLMAGQYWVIYHLTGETLEEHPFAIGRLMLITWNAIPLALMLLATASLIERFGTTDWGRLFAMSAASFGTFHPTFAVVLNNHLPAAVSVTFALYFAAFIWCDGSQRLGHFFFTGLFAAFAVANELPALSFLAVLSAALLFKSPGRTLLAYVPAVLIVAAGFFGTNKIAHDSWRPPYMHRSASDPDDNWYDYQGSYWMSEKVGVDRGEPSRAVYAFHVLIGHHGVFSLTPIWLMSLVGIGLAWRGSNRPLAHLALMTALLTAVCLAFYIARPLIDRNYGGVSSGFRWMFWLTPLWLVTLCPTADRMSTTRPQRILAYTLLGLSALSAAYPTWNPWVQPWLYEYL